jgi:hypothetical protein
MLPAIEARAPHPQSPIQPIWTGDETSMRSRIQAQWSILLTIGIKESNDWPVGAATIAAWLTCRCTAGCRRSSVQRTSEQIRWMYIFKFRAALKQQRQNMTSIPDRDQEQCPRCGSKLVNIEWDERVNAQEVQTLRHCLNCKNEFVSLEASKGEQPSSGAEITKPFFTSLVIE